MLGGGEDSSPGEGTRDLLQLVGLGLVLVSVCILPVGQTEGPDGQDAVNVVPDP